MTFHYSSYWRNWSRVLSTNHPSGPFVEVDLTPINGWNCSYQGHVDKVRSVNIRRHGTARNKRDFDVAKLPADVIYQMHDHLGRSLQKNCFMPIFCP